MDNEENNVQITVIISKALRDKIQLLQKKEMMPSFSSMAAKLLKKAISGYKLKNKGEDHTDDDYRRGYRPF